MDILTIDQHIPKILVCSQNSPLELAKHDGPIFDRFDSHPIVDTDDSSETGMWGVLIKAMGYAYGPDVLPEVIKHNLKGEIYELECVFTYLSRAHKHTTWNLDHNSLLMLKLNKIIDGLMKLGSAKTSTAPEILLSASLTEGQEIAKDTCKAKDKAKIMNSPQKESTNSIIPISSDISKEESSLSTAKLAKSTQISTESSQKVTLPDGFTQNANSHWGTDFFKASVERLRE
ncbi:hypothetical protein DFH28DRAFT_922027 [Melampsora americana]|nr:hypothetical protein DFH28DRAFT_922027 [Melampsora americana]